MKPDILQTIRNSNALLLEAQKRAQPFDELLEAARRAPARASFKSALKKDGGVAVIAELKKASPSRGLIRAEFDVPALASSLEKAGASAMSVLTEPKYFLGSDANLEIAAGIVEIPLLYKNFVFDKYQICRAKVCGASAVLLIARMLSAEEFAELSAFAKSLNLDALCEAHTADEVDFLASAGAEIIGVNCRNLSSFETDFTISERLLSRIPDGVVRVSESAIDSRETLLRAQAAGADAALIGTSLMSAENPAQKLAELLGK